MQKTNIDKNSLPQWQNCYNYLFAQNEKKIEWNGLLGQMNGACIPVGSIDSSWFSAECTNTSIVDLAIVVDILWKGAPFVWPVEMVQLTN